MREHLCRLQDAHHGEENDGQQGGDSKWDAFRAPVERHENDGVAAFCLLQWWEKTNLIQQKHSVMAEAYEETRLYNRVCLQSLGITAINNS